MNINQAIPGDLIKLILIEADQFDTLRLVCKKWRSLIDDIFTKMFKQYQEDPHLKDYAAKALTFYPTETFSMARVRLVVKTVLIRGDNKTWCAKASLILAHRLSELFYKALTVNVLFQQIEDNLPLNQFSYLPHPSNAKPLVRMANLQDWITSHTISLRTINYLSFPTVKLRSLPVEIKYLEGLKTLDVHGNELNSLPVEIAHLTALETLNLSQNRLTRLIPEIGELTALTNLDLRQNQLTTLPIAFSKLTRLVTLRLEENPIVTLPQELTGMPALRPLQLTLKRKREDEN